MKWLEVVKVVAPAFRDRLDVVDFPTVVRLQPVLVVSDRRPASVPRVSGQRVVLGLAPDLVDGRLTERRTRARSAGPSLIR